MGKEHKHDDQKSHSDDMMHGHSHDDDSHMDQAEHHDHGSHDQGHDHEQHIEHDHGAMISAVGSEADAHEGDHAGHHVDHSGHEQMFRDRFWVSLPRDWCTVYVGQHRDCVDQRSIAA